MKQSMLLLLMFVAVNVYAGTVGSGDCSTFPGTKDAKGTDLTANDYATVNYANDVKHCIDNIEQFLISTPSFMTANVGIGINAPKEKLQVAGNVAWTGVFYSSGAGNNYLNGTVTSTKFIQSSATISTGQIHSRIATGTAPLTVNSTTKVTNLNADLIESNHILSGSVSSDGTGYTQVNFGSVFSSTVAFVSSVTDSTSINHTCTASVSLSSATITTWNNANSRTGPIAVHWIAIGN